MKNHGSQSGTKFIGKLAGMLLGGAVRQVVKAETGNAVVAMVAGGLAGAAATAVGHYLFDQD